MKRKGLSTIATLILFLLSLIVGAIVGFMRLNRTPPPPGYVPVDKADEEAIEMEAPTVIKDRERPVIEKKTPKEEPPRSYRIEGVGSKDRVPVDLPDRPNPVVAKEGESPTVRLPKDIEDIGRKVKEQIDALDEATRKSIKSMLDSINLEELEPDKATIRPKGDGLELKFSIPID